jgi:tungstate transport system substrate-binding protein
MGADDRRESQSRSKARRGPRAVATLVAAALAVAAASALTGCGPGNESAVQRDQLIVATTTSLDDSGLLEDVVLPAYAEIEPDVTVKVIAVGSGEAIAMGAQGEVDVLLVHSPADEEQFMAQGHGTLRLPFAYNHFIIVGPADDPAGVSSAASAADGFAAIVEAGAPCVSRGDESGTHKKELEIWESAGVDPAGDWYLVTGQGMGETLRIASEKEAYTLTDLGTYLSQQQSLDLEPLFTGSDDLKNVYDVIVVDQNEFATVNAAAAEVLAQWLVSAEGQKAIGGFGVAEHGEPLFNPYAGSLGAY